jgi:hypothetical protein
MQYLRCLLLLLFATFSITANASQPPLPTKCPGATAIQAAHFWIEKDYDNSYTAFQDDQKYDTDGIWNFMIWRIKANSLEEASQKVTAALSSLSLRPGPMQPALGLWKCVYNIGFGYEASAYNPPI